MRIWPVVVASAAIVTILFLVVSANRYPYAFLDKYHPRRKEVDLQKLLPFGPKGSSHGGKTILLVFNEKDSKAVLAEMKKNLSPSNGFTVKNLLVNGGDSPISGSNDQWWQFNRNDNEGAVFASGVTGGFQHGLYGSGQLGLGSRTATVVIVTHQDNWVERLGRSLGF
jgi:hypothetical protein